MRSQTGAEIRFLRKHIGLSAKKFADLIGADATTLSKYENAKREVSISKDRLIRTVTVALADGLEARWTPEVRQAAKQGFPIR